MPAQGPEIILFLLARDRTIRVGGIAAAALTRASRVSRSASRNKPQKRVSR
jgi:hypothetical protein